MTNLSSIEASDRLGELDDRAQMREQLTARRVLQMTTSAISIQTPMARCVTFEVKLERKGVIGGHTSRTMNRFALSLKDSISLTQNGTSMQDSRMRSLIVCSSCLSRKTTPFCRILTAQYCPVDFLRLSKTRPNEPVPSVRTPS